jgi:hypothetical protein
MARGIWVYAGTIYLDETAVFHLLAGRRAEFTAALLNVAVAAAQRDAPPYTALPARVPVSQDGQVGCG